jgi:hypothetical protein
MSESDPWAPVYDAWATYTTEDVELYVSLAHEADGPIVHDESLEFLYVTRNP